jgi:hypothetical protein
MKIARLFPIVTMLLTVATGIGSAIQMWMLSGMMNNKVFSEGEAVVLSLQNPFFLKIVFSRHGEESYVAYWPTVLVLISLIFQLVMVATMRRKGEAK